ncbi:MAG: dual specificity protein phosphatase, partial [Anaerolineae bacterium]|nr:dual specificity protein phosphatase [Anaerolineae bacterium]
TTVIWFYGRGLPFMTGVPVKRYSQVTPDIFVGAQFGPAGKSRLERWGISGAVNMRIEFDDAAHNLALERYCHLPTVDDHAPSLEHLEQGVQFIQQVLADGGKVYIHCAGGIGRAPTMAAAYFISQGLSLADAIALIKKARPFINIMPPQMAQLERFEAKQIRSI